MPAEARRQCPLVPAEARRHPARGKRSYPIRYIARSGSLSSSEFTDSKAFPPLRE